MKLLINSTLRYTDSYSPGTSDEDIDDLYQSWREVTDLCDKLGVHYMFDAPAGSIVFYVYAQKVTLEESCMNELFADVLTYFKFNLEYAHLGGRGCDMALTLTEDVK